MFRVISSQSLPIRTAHIFEMGMSVSPVATSVSNRMKAATPNMRNSKNVCERRCFILDVDSSKVSLTTIQGGKSE